MRYRPVSESTGCTTANSQSVAYRSSNDIMWPEPLTYSIMTDLHARTRVTTAMQNLAPRYIYLASKFKQAFIDVSFTKRYALPHPHHDARDRTTCSSLIKLMLVSPNGATMSQQTSRTQIRSRHRTKSYADADTSCAFHSAFPNNSDSQCHGTGTFLFAF